MTNLKCDNHNEWDGDQPIGPDCGKPVTHIIVWPTYHSWSASCADHHGEGHFKDAPEHTVYELASVPFPLDQLN